MHFFYIISLAIIETNPAQQSYYVPDAELSLRLALNIF